MQQRIWVIRNKGHPDGTKKLGIGQRQKYGSRLIISNEHLGVTGKRKMKMPFANIICVINVRSGPLKIFCL